MSDSGYTPSMEDIRLGFACYSDNRDMSLYKYDREAGLREWERIRDEAFAKFDAAVAAHDAVIREDERKLQIERDVMICQRIHDDPGFPESGTGVITAKIVIRGQSFTGTEET